MSYFLHLKYSIAFSGLGHLFAPETVFFLKEEVGQSVLFKSFRMYYIFGCTINIAFPTLHFYYQMNDITYMEASSLNFVSSCDTSCISQGETFFTAKLL